jgi:hypothetical protein
MPGRLVQALIQHIDSSFTGPNGDYPAVLEAIAGLTAAQAMWKPTPSSTSIWQIVDHLTASKRWAPEMLATGQADPPVWADPKGGEDTWQRSISVLQETHNQLKAALAQLEDAALLEIPDHAQSRALLEYILSSGTAHEAHHGGQIDYLRGLQEH